MMKKVFWLLVWFILAGCTPQLAETPTVENVTLVAAANTATTAPSPSPLPPTLPAPSLTPSPLIFEDLSLDDIHSTPVTATPIVTPTTTATPVVPVEPVCPEAGAPASFARPNNNKELKLAIQTYLNAGGQWNALDDLLTALEINFRLIPVDVNDDNTQEMILVITRSIVVDETDLDGNLRPIWVWQCHDGNYRIITEDFLYWNNRLDQITTADINENPGDEIIKQVDVLLSACIFHIEIWEWRDKQLQPIEFVDAQWFESDCSATISWSDLNRDGIPELIIHGWTVSHMDNAPPRGFTETYTLQEQGYKLLSHEFAPAEYVIHVLDDAQQAFDADNLALAVQYYEQAAYDNSLKLVTSHYLLSPGSMGVAEGDSPDAYQRSFALFRLAAMQTVVGNIDAAITALTELETRYPEGTPGHEFVVLAHQLVEALNTGQEPIFACQEITASIEEMYPTLHLHFYWGGNVVWYFPDTLCPFVAE